jgi:23S rRNA pseudouridine1911/1915/1917 synthase
MAVVASGKPARTHVTPLSRFGAATLVRCALETGRTHQIRVHLAFIGHPAVGDQTYGKRPFRHSLKRQFLHATYLKFQLPGGRPIEVETGLPPDLQAVLQRLRAESTEGNVP